MFFWWDITTVVLRQKKNYGTIIWTSPSDNESLYFCDDPQATHGLTIGSLRVMMKYWDAMIGRIRAYQGSVGVNENIWSAGFWDCFCKVSLILDVSFGGNSQMENRKAWPRYTSSNKPWNVSHEEKSANRITIPYQLPYWKTKKKYQRPFCEAWHCLV